MAQVSSNSSTSQPTSQLDITSLSENFSQWADYDPPMKNAEEWDDFKKKAVFEAFDFDQASAIMSKAADDLNEYTGSSNSWFSESDSPDTQTLKQEISASGALYGPRAKFTWRPKRYKLRPDHRAYPGCPPKYSEGCGLSFFGRVEPVVVKHPLEQRSQGPPSDHAKPIRETRTFIDLGTRTVSIAPSREGQSKVKTDKFKHTNKRAYAKVLARAKAQAAAAPVHKDHKAFRKALHIAQENSMLYNEYKKQHGIIEAPRKKPFKPVPDNPNPVVPTLAPGMKGMNDVWMGSVQDSGFGHDA